MEEKKKQFMIRNFELCTSIDESFNQQEFEQKLKDYAYAVEWAYIIHDKDVNKDGTPKHKHIHLFVQGDNTHPVSVHAKYFGVAEQFIERIKDKRFYRACRYLTHLNAPEKYQYPMEDVRASFNYRDKMVKDIVQSNNEQLKTELIKDILGGAVKKYDIHNHAKKMNIDETYLVKWRRDIENAFKVKNEKVGIESNRSMEVIYIYGKSGVGKSSFGKYLAQKKNYHVFISSSSNDIFDGYAEEECVLLDDVRYETFQNYADSLKLFDNNTSSRYRSRYYNKLILADLIILTSTQPIDSVFNNLNEDARQIRRRISTVIELNEKEAIVSAYDEKTNQYYESFRFENPLNEYLKNLPKKEKKDTISWLRKTFIE